MLLNKLILTYLTASGISYFFWNYQNLGHLISPIFADIEETKDVVANMTVEEKQEILQLVSNLYGLDMTIPQLDSFLSILVNLPTVTPTNLNIQKISTKQITQTKPKKDTKKPEIEKYIPKNTNVKCRSNSRTFHDIKWIHSYGVIEGVQHKYLPKYNVYKLELEIYPQNGKCNHSETHNHYLQNQNVDFYLNFKTGYSNLSLWWYDDRAFPDIDNLVEYLKDKLLGL